MDFMGSSPELRRLFMGIKKGLIFGLSLMKSEIS